MFAGAHRYPANTSTREQPSRAETAAAREQKQDHNNSTWQSLALRVQPKLSISEPGDADEREADQIADRVMRMAAPQSACSCTRASQKIQRKCAGCEEEEERVQRKSRSPQTVTTARVDQALSSQGRPLDAHTQSFMESRFGRDFSNVRVHNDAHSATSAESIHAKAYTIGPNIVFGAGMYQPGTNDGRRLLAHELAHTVQQNVAGPRIQRDTDEDFLVTQVQPDPEKRTEGMSDRFFFEMGESTFRADVAEEAAELARLEAWAKAHKGEHVRLIGRSSQEGTAGGNSDIAWKRVATVRSVLKSEGVIVDNSAVDLTFKQRPVEYRFYRSVEIVVGTPTCSNFTKKQREQDKSDCEDAFTKAHKRATSIVDAGMARLRPDKDPPPATQPQPNTPAPPRESRDTVLNNHFPGIDRSTLLPLFESIATRLGEVGTTKGHTCNHRCESGCERPASAAAGEPVELCAAFYIPDFTRALAVDERVYAVLHETTHSAVVPGTKPAESVGIDFAYGDTRLFGALTGSEALKNADSFVMTLMLLAEDAGGALAAISSSGTAPADSLKLTTPPAETADRNRTARRALGFAQSWLNYSTFWTPNVYDFLDASLASWTHLGSLGHQILELWTAPFQLNHPGNKGIDATDLALIEPFQKAVAARGFTAPAPKLHATRDDRTRVAGIYDRFTRMHDAVRKQDLTVERTASGDGSWSNATGLPGLGATVKLADSFFLLSAEEQSRHIIRLMARAMSDIASKWEESYVEGADGVHQLRQLGP